MVSPGILLVVVTFPNSPFRLAELFKPAGDQPEAIDKLTEGIATLGAARQLERTSIGVDGLAVLGCRLLEHGLRRSSKSGRAAGLRKTRRHT